MASNLKRIAFYRAKQTTQSAQELCDALKLWWSDKYKLPDNHPLLLQKTLEELMVDYYTDLFRRDEKAAKEFDKEIHGRADMSLTDEEKADEEWFKAMMGDGYISPDEPIRSSSGEAMNFETNTEEELGFEENFDSHTDSGDAHGE